MSVTVFMILLDQRWVIHINEVRRGILTIMSRGWRGLAIGRCSGINLMLMSEVAVGGLGWMRKWVVLAVQHVSIGRAAFV